MNLLRLVKLHVLVFIVSLISGLSFAQTKDDLNSLFYSANKSYEQGKYEDAAGDYKKILDMGYQSGQLYYNLGNTYFKLGSLGKTILYYEKAKRLMPQNPELKFNYNYVQSLLEDKLEQPKRSWITKKVEEILAILPYGKWLGFAAIIWLVCIGCVILRIYFPALKNVLKYINTITLCVFIAVIVFAGINHNTQSSKCAVILSKEIAVRYGPGEAEVEAFLLHEGTTAAVIKQEDNWCQIRLPDGKSGWLPKDSIEII